MVRIARHRLWLAAIAVAVLTACSNGRGSVSDPASPPVNEPPPAPPVPPPSPPTPPPTDPPPPTPPPEPEPTSAGMAGYWKGTATEQDSDRTFDAVVLIDAEGNSQWVLTRDGLVEDDGFVVSANVCCESQFNGDGTGKELRDTRAREARIEAQASGGVLSGELEFHDEDYDFRLNASSEYDRSLSLAALAGVYTRSTGSILGSQVTLTVTIDANGQLNGSYSNGCVFNGNASIPDVSHNMVQLQIDLANCGERGTGSAKTWNGAYSGLGVLLSGDDVFYHSVLGPTWLGPQSVER